MNSLVLIIIGIISSIIISFFIITRILVVTYRKCFFDVVNERKVHQGMIPRLGGVSFVPSILITLLLMVGLHYLIGYNISQGELRNVIQEFCFLICGLVFLFFAGIKDDLTGLNYCSKFVVQIVAAIMFPLSGLWVNNLFDFLGIHELVSWVGIPVTVLLVVFICNAINLIDGIDGLASGLSGISLAVLGYLYIQAGLWMYAFLAFVSLAVLVPFSYYNVFGQASSRTKIFMGDTGSLTLGYIQAFLIIRYWTGIPEAAACSDRMIIIAFSTLLIPMFDVVRVMFIRWRTNKKLFIADKNHIHHKLLKVGFTQRQAVVMILAMACLFNSMNIYLAPYLDKNLLIGICIFVWVVLNKCFNRYL